MYHPHKQCSDSPGGYHTTVDRSDLLLEVAGVQPEPDVIGALSPVFGRPADHSPATEDRPIGPPSHRMDSKATNPVDDLGMPPELATISWWSWKRRQISSQLRVIGNLILNPPSASHFYMNWERWTRLPRKSRSILLEVSSGQLPALEAACIRVHPEPSEASTEEVPTGVAALLHAPTSLRPLF